MRRFLGLAFLLGAFACADSVDPSPGDVAPPTASTSATAPRGGTAIEAARGGPTRSTLRTRATPSGACATSVTLHGNPGAVIAQPSITLLFWGSYWSASGATERQSYTTAWSTVAGDPAFYARFAEYSTAAATIGSGSWAGASLGDPSLASGATITDAQIQDELAAEIASGVAARLSANRVYVVMLPPSVTSQLDHDDGFAGHHGQFTAAALAFPVRYAVITYASDAGYTDPVISHEIAEATTDPDVANGWYDQNGEEIGDLCRFDYATLDGVTIETTWSARSCSCVGGTTTAVDAGVPDAAPPSCAAPAWSASASYVGGTIVSFGGSEYTAAYWNQAAEPDTHSGASGSGQPWLVPVACTATPAPSCVPSCNLKQCGNDGCGGSCGNCGAGLECNPNNQCVAPTTTSSCGGVPPWSASQTWYAYTVGEQHVGSNGHRYTCRNVAYCIDDPTGYVGGTYGWTDDGPC